MSTSTLDFCNDQKMKPTTVPSIDPMKRSPLRRAFLRISLLLICFGLSPTVKAVSPEPDGGYPNGNRNTATGAQALNRNTRKNDNTANGFNVLNFSEGNGNTAIGSRVLDNNLTGNSNIALGDEAGRNLNGGSSNIDIGNEGVAGEGSTIRIGSASQTKTFIAGISGAGVTGAAVQVNAAGHLGTAPSSERFKDQIKQMDKASEAVLALKPVTFRYKTEIDPTGISQFGLVAEEVEKVNADLVVRDKEGKPYSVRYDQVNAMLLNEFLKEHRKVDEQQATIVEL